MKFLLEMETMFIAISGLLSTLFIVELIYSLRSILLWRVNCWFCDSNFWVKYVERNFWTCPSCEQYNGFTKDGDYNRPIAAAAAESNSTIPVFRSSPKNGLCKMCNINQQLKVAQLANFVPMNDTNFDKEVEGYRLRLEEAYKLCGPCSQVLKNKLHKEKESLLGNKLMESRSPDKKTNRKQETQKKTLQNIINMTTKYIAVLFLILVSLECYRNMMKNNTLSHTITNIWQIVSSLFERIVAIIKMKLVITFPDIEIYLNEVDILYNKLTSKYMTIYLEYNSEMNIKTLEALAAIASSIKIIGSMWNGNKLNLSFFVDCLWVMFLISSVLYNYLNEHQVIISFVKLTIISTMLLVYRSMKKTDGMQSSGSVTRKNTKNLSNGSKTLDDDDLSMETDDDVSLCQFGLHSHSESSNDSPKQIHNNSKVFNQRCNEKIRPKTKNDLSKLNNSFINERSFTPQNNNGIWSNSKLNSTFCVNSLLTKTPSSVSETAFIKPTFIKSQSFDDDLSDDSDLDQSISSLYIGSPKKSKSKKNNSIFSLQKFRATPSFAVPARLTRKPLISPGKLGHSTSWVAGGYWGSDERLVFNADGSRSSSQSSGFESQTSSLNTQRNVFSQPPCRDQYVDGESDRAVLDQLSNCSVSTKGPQKFARISSPVFPQMQYNSHVHIPQAKFAQSQILFARHEPQFNPNSPFKAPSRSRSNLQSNPFLSR